MSGDWVWYLGAAVLGAGAFGLFAWAWWGDRSRGRARCGRCWYSLESLQGEATDLPVCPECGWKAKRRRQLFKSRRRKGWVAGALILAMGAGACTLAPKARRDGVWSVVPTWAMWGAVRAGWRSDDFARELCARLAAGEDEQAGAERVYRWTPSLHLTRAAWVKGVPLRASSHSIYYSGTGSKGALMFSLPGRGYNSADVYAVQSHENWWSPDKWLADDRFFNPATGRADVLRSRLGREQWERGEGWASVRMVDDVDEVMRPQTMSGSEIVSLIKPSLFILPSTELLALSVADVNKDAWEKGLALGIRAEIVRDGKVIGAARWCQDGGSNAMGGRPVLVRFPAGERAQPMRRELPMPWPLERLIDDGCVVRFSTDVEMALSAFECDKYWKGTFEVPLKDLVK